MRFSWLVLVLAGLGLIYLGGMSGCVHDPYFPEIVPNDTIPTDTVPIDTTPVVVDTTAYCSPDTLYFAADIFPILERHHCVACHKAANNLGGVVLTNYQTLINSNIVDLEKPEDGKLLRVVVDTDPGKVMPPPPDTMLNAHEVLMLRLWVEQGAKNRACDTIACDMTGIGYAATVRPLLETRCLGCHTAGNNPGGGIGLDTYSGVQAAALSGKLFGAVAHIEGFEAMPKGEARISDCDLSRLRRWTDDGARNN
ncbi:MAG: hypothetical protein OHK0039_23230 [Bacteroidia bacterium]